jgi:acyl-CoA synthetase (AMP-forming)/AMP-acid ligase II
VLHCAPLSHGAGFHALTAVARGAENVVLARSDPGEILAAIARHRVTAAWLVPTQIRMLLDHPDLDGADLSSLVSVVYGGSPMYRSDLVEAIERIGPVFCQIFAQGESPMTVTYLRREEHRADRPDAGVLSSAGVARTGMEIRIADADDRVLPAGEPGEIQVRGPAVMAGYWRRPEATAETLRGGWLHTGDVGRLDERGYLYVLDRLKDMIITGGSNVYAQEVEDVLLRHPAVREAAVFGTPDRLWGEAVTAVVVGAAGVVPGADELRAFCREHLADYMRPKHVHVVDALPRNSYGKVLKRELREKYAVP